MFSRNLGNFQLEKHLHEALHNNEYTNGEMSERGAKK